MRGLMRFIGLGRLLTVGAIAFIITLAAALAAFLCDRPGFGVPRLPSGLHAVSALSGLTAGASPVLHSDMGWQYQHQWWRKRLGELGIRQSMSRKGNCLENRCSAISRTSSTATANSTRTSGSRPSSTTTSSTGTPNDARYDSLDTPRRNSGERPPWSEPVS